MKEYYITKRDINGNRYTLEIDHGAKTYKADYNPFGHYAGVLIGKRERHRKMEALERAGYTRTW